MAGENYVSVPGVVAISDALTLICDVNGRRVGVPIAAICPNSEVRKAGDRGTLLVERAMAQRLRLIA